MTPRGEFHLMCERVQEQLPKWKSLHLMECLAKRMELLCIQIERERGKVFRHFFHKTIRLSSFTRERGSSPLDSLSHLGRRDANICRAPISQPSLSLSLSTFFHKNFDSYRVSLRRRKSDEEADVMNL